MFSKKEFQNWGKKDAVLFASVATKIPGRKDDRLLEDYGFYGFPSFAILDANGEAITKKVGRNLSSMQAAVKSATEYARLAAKAAAGKKVDKSKLVLAGLELGKLDVSDAKRELRGLKLSKKRRAEVDARVLAAELQRLVDIADRNTDRAGDKVYELFKEGKRPAPGSKLTGFYDSMLLRGAENAGDGKAYLSAYSRVRKGLKSEVESVATAMKEAEDSQSRRRYESQLEKLKSRIAYIDARAKEFEQAATESGDKKKRQ